MTTHVATGRHTPCSLRRCELRPHSRRHITALAFHHLGQGIGAPITSSPDRSAPSMRETSTRSCRSHAQPGRRASPQAALPIAAEQAITAFAIPTSLLRLLLASLLVRPGFPARPSHIRRPPPHTTWRALSPCPATPPCRTGEEELLLRPPPTHPRSSGQEPP